MDNTPYQETESITAIYIFLSDLEVANLFKNTLYGGLAKLNMPQKLMEIDS